MQMGRRCVSGLQWSPLSAPCSASCPAVPAQCKKIFTRWRGPVSLQPAKTHTHTHLHTDTTRHTATQSEAPVRHGIHLGVLIERLMFLWPVEPIFLPFPSFSSLIPPSHLPFFLPLFSFPLYLYSITTPFFCLSIYFLPPVIFPLFPPFHLSYRLPSFIHTHLLYPAPLPHLHRPNLPFLLPFPSPPTPFNPH